MAEAVVRNEIPDQRLGKVHLRFRWYHATLLQVLSERRLPAHAVFVSLYRKNATPSILRFLNDESCFMEELKIMSSTNIPVFVRAGLKAAWSMIK
jgi:lycopene beta-cyclase